MVNQQVVNKFLNWTSSNKNYLEIARPNKKRLLKKLNNNSFNLTSEELDFLLSTYGRNVKNTKQNTEGTNVWVPLEMVDTVKELNAIYQESLSIGVPVEDIKHGWLKNDKSSMFFTNPLYKDKESLDLDTINFKELFGKIEPITIKKVETSKNTALFDRLVFTDVHVGMDVASSGYSLYDLKWDKEELFKRLEIMVQHTIEHKKSNTLIINDLGDFLDGYNSLTTRGGHKLPQNMSTSDAFDVALEFKIKLVKSLAPYFEKIKFINICNDNHAGHFGYITNSAFKVYIEEAIKNIEVINQRKFIDYYIIENRCFCLTHGKDDANMKFGFKPKADPATVNKVIGYLNQIEVLNKGYFEIEFGKGDSHLAVLDDSSSDVFGYYSYPAFSPSSNWVQLNFNKGRSGFVHFNYMDNRKNINPYYF
jgi:hypothetical protein